MKSLSNVLRDLEDVIPERSLSDQHTADFTDILRGCEDVLKALDKVLDRYSDLSDVATLPGSNRKPRRLWKRLTFEPNDVGDLRSRMTSNIGLLNAFMGRAAL